MFNATGTPGPIVSVVGALVCNPGATGAMGATQAVIDTPAAVLSPMGNAELSFKLTDVPSACALLVPDPDSAVRVALDCHGHSAGYDVSIGFSQCDQPTVPDDSSPYNFYNFLTHSLRLNGRLFLISGCAPEKGEGL